MVFVPDWCILVFDPNTFPIGAWYDYDPAVYLWATFDILMVGDVLESFKGQSISNAVVTRASAKHNTYTSNNMRSV